MALYINPENQTHLWNTIQSHPKFIPYIRQYPPEKITGWFRSTIEGFYRKWGNRPMNMEELKQLNQNTVAYLYQSITSLQPSSTPPIVNSPPVQTSIQQQFQQHPSMPKPLPEFHGQHEFEQRAQEYQAMNSKPASAPLQGKTDADHRESQDEMERRWMEQQRLRDKDVEQFSPPSQVNGAQAINLNLLKSTAPISESQNAKETESIQLKIRELSESKEPLIMAIERNRDIREGITMSEKLPEQKLEQKLEQKPVWLERIERIEQLQEKMALQIEKMFQHILSSNPNPNPNPNPNSNPTYNPTENNKNRTMKDIDE